MRAPRAEGVNFTLMVHDALAAKAVPQVLVCEKSAPLVPEIAMLEILNAVAPRFVIVTLLAALAVPTIRLAKEIVAADKDTAVPVPLKLTV